MMRPTVRQRTVEPRRPRPEPITEPEATWVVDSAKPRALEARIVAAVELSAEKPCAGLTSVRPLPRVRMMRQPPMYVPRAIVMAHAKMTQVCGSGSLALCQPAVISSEGDDAHRLLRVVGAVRERDERRREDLARRGSRRARRAWRRSDA